MLKDKTEKVAPQTNDNDQPSPLRSEEREMRLLVNEGLTDYEPEIGRWLWALEDTRRRTKLLLEEVVEPWMIDWVPDAKANSSGVAFER